MCGSDARVCFAGGLFLGDIVQCLLGGVLSRVLRSRLSIFSSLFGFYEVDIEGMKRSSRFCSNVI